MGIGTIGVTSAVAAFQPAGSADLVASHKIRGFEKISLNAGNYVVHADEDMCFFDGRDYLGYVKAGKSGTISIAANSTEVFAEAMTFKWKPATANASEGYASTNISAGRPYTFSDDGQIVCELDSTSRLYISTDGGETYGTSVVPNTIWTSNNSGGFHSSSPAVAPNGTIYVAPYNNQSGGNRVSYSTNNGASWGTIGRSDSQYDYGSAVARVGSKIVVLHHQLATTTQSMIQIFDPSVSTSAPEHYFYVTGLNSYTYSSSSYYTGIAAIPGTNRARIFWYDSSGSYSYTFRYYDLNLDGLPSSGTNTSYSSSLYTNTSQPNEGMLYFHGEPGNERVALPYMTNSQTPAFFEAVPSSTGTSVSWTQPSVKIPYEGAGYFSTPSASIGSMVGTVNTMSPVYSYRLRAGDSSNRDIFGASTVILAPTGTSGVTTNNVRQASGNIGEIVPFEPSGSSSYRPKKLPNGRFIMPFYNMEALPANLYIYSEVA